MNFVSHFYFDGLENNSHFNFGLILPDLMSIYKRGWRITERGFDKTISAEESKIISGVLKHYELDNLFHQSEYFRNHTAEIKNIINSKISYDHPRKHFISHILLELIIDKILIDENSAILDLFYLELEGVEKSEVLNFYRHDDSGHKDDFFLFFDRFRTKRYLYNYSQVESLVFVLNKILERVKLPELKKEEEKENLYEIIEKSAALIKANFNDLNEIREIKDFNH